LNVKGAAIATVVCYGIAASLDFIAVIRYSGISIPLMDFFIKPLIGAGLMSLTVYLGYHYLLPILGTSISTLLSVLVGIVVYSLLLLLTGAVKKGDFELLPAGKRISSLLVKLKLLKD
jgi:stage V sporulation protein B